LPSCSAKCAARDAKATGRELKAGHRLSGATVMGRSDEVHAMVMGREERDRVTAMPHGKRGRVMETDRVEKVYAMVIDLAKSVHRFGCPVVMSSDHATVFARQSDCRGKQPTDRVKVVHVKVARVQTLQAHRAVRVVRWALK